MIAPPSEYGIGDDTTDDGGSSGGGGGGSTDDDDPFADGVVGGIGGGYTGGYEDPTGGGSASSDADVTDTGDPDATEDDIPETGWGGVVNTDDGVVDTTPNQDQSEDVQSPADYEVGEDPGYAEGGPTPDDATGGGSSDSQPATNDNGNDSSGLPDALPDDLVALNDQAMAILGVAAVGLAFLYGGD